MTELKNCPFCGHPFEIVYSDDYDGYMIVHPYNCPMETSESETGFVYESEEDAINQLNTRPIEDALQARIDELEKELSDARFCMALHGWGGSLTAEPKENE